MRRQNNRQIGDKKEEFVCEWLETQGYRIVERNFRCRSGEIDIVAREGAYLVFIEVKYRKNKQCGGSLYAVPRAKQQKICYAARHYIAKHSIPLNHPMRFDVLAIDGEEIMHIQNAFETY